MTRQHRSHSIDSMLTGFLLVLGIVMNAMGLQIGIPEAPKGLPLTVKNFAGLSTDVCIDTLESPKGLPVYASPRYSVAMRGSHIVVGQPDSNLVSVYRRDANGNWSRIARFGPPRDSDIDRVGAGFGREVALSDNKILIAASYSTAKPGPLDGIDWYRGPYNDYLTGGIFSTPLDAPGVVETISVSGTDKLVGYSLAANSNSFAFGFLNKLLNAEPKRSVLLRQGSALRRFEAPPGDLADGFGHALALSEDKFIVGSPVSVNAGAGLLYLLDDNAEPIRIEGAPGATSAAATSVAVGRGWAAVASSEGIGQLRTTVHIENSGTFELPYGGTLSGSDNILTVTQPGTPDRERQSKLYLVHPLEDHKRDPTLTVQKVLAAYILADTLTLIKESTEGARVCVSHISTL